MNPSSPIPASPVRRWRRAAGVLLFLLVAGVTLFALFHAVENWRGQRAWARYQREATARAETLDFRTLTPAEIPDTENFAANALVDSWFARRDSRGTDWWPDTFSRALARIRRSKSAERRFTDLVAWKEALGDAGAAMEGTKITPRARTADEQRDAARAVLAEMKVYEPALDELRRALPRPGARYPINYLVDDPFTILLPHLPKVKAVAQVLNLRACAHLAAGDIAGAHQDALLGLRMADSLRDEMFIISQLVRVACLDQALQPVWEGIAQGKWSDAQLQQFQERLSSIDFVTALDRSLRAERAAGIAFMQQARKRGFAQVFEIISPEPSQEGILPALSWLMPRGWFDMEQVSYCTLLDLQLTNTLDLAAKTIDVAAFDEGGKQVEELLGIGFFEQWRHHRVLARLILPALGKASRRYASAQVQVDQAQIACALERYRLAHGKLPESLNALAPRFLARVPHDVLTGQPFTYQRDGEQFALLSAGAGMPVGEKESGRPGEWQWRYNHTNDHASHRVKMLLP